MGDSANLLEKILGAPISELLSIVNWCKKTKFLAELSTIASIDFSGKIPICEGIPKSFGFCPSKEGKMLTEKFNYLKMENSKNIT